MVSEARRLTKLTRSSGVGVGVGGVEGVGSRDGWTIGGGDWMGRAGWGGVEWRGGMGAGGGGWGWGWVVWGSTHAGGQDDMSSKQNPSN